MILHKVHSSYNIKVSGGVSEGVGVRASRNLKTAKVLINNKGRTEHVEVDI